MVEESGDPREGVMDQPQAIAHHRLDGFPDGQVSHFRVVSGRLIDDLTHAECVAHSRHKAEVIQYLATVGGWVSQKNLL
jgi:hypothetical protein